jgi:hypothetical protein
MNITLHLRIAGILLIALSLLHVLFPGRFHWREELARLSSLNRQMFQLHCFFIALIVMVLGVVSLFFAPALIAPGPLARIVLTCITLFWLFRLLAQFFFYDPKLWRGNRFRTFIHIVFSLLWCYLLGVYGTALRMVLES